MNVSIDLGDGLDSALQLGSIKNLEQILPKKKREREKKNTGAL